MEVYSESGVFSPLNFKSYLLFEFRSYRKSNELRLKPLKNYIDLTHQKFKVTISESR